MKLTMPRRFWAQAALVGMLTGAHPGAEAANVTVQIINFSFQASSVNINAGDTVTWIQRDATIHTSTSDGNVWDSGILNQGQSFSFTFKTAGNFPYHCAVHPFMTGVVNVAAANQPPSVQITSPANNQVFVSPTNVVLSATASDPDGTVSKVEFFDGASSLGALTAAPYSITLTNPAPGGHTFTAKATDNAGATATSAAVIIQVNAPPGTNQPPTVAITSPQNGSLFIAPANVVVQAQAADPDGAIAQLSIFLGRELVASANGPTATATLTNLASGRYQLSAKATDNGGAGTTSDPIAFNVTGFAVYAQQNLVSDLPGVAARVDTNLLNPWGLVMSAPGEFRVMDNHAGLATAYDAAGSSLSPAIIVPPPAGGMPPAAPSGAALNNTSDFQVGAHAPARFIFSTEDGTIGGWSTGANATLKVDNSSQNAVYKGIALAASGGANFIYATDFHNGKVGVFDSSFQPVALAGGFADPSIPSGFAPFGIAAIGGNLFVSYAKQDDQKHDDQAGPGNGFVDVFSPEGKLLRRFAAQGPLNSPWGMAVAPAGFGPFGGALLVGNFGDGRINAFDLNSGGFRGPLIGANGAPIVIQGLWGLVFGAGAISGDALKLFFTAGIPGGGALEDHGLFGILAPVPAIRIAMVQNIGATVKLEWTGGVAPYHVQMKGQLTDRDWSDALLTNDTQATVANNGSTAFFRVVGQNNP